MEKEIEREREGGRGEGKVVMDGTEAGTLRGEGRKEGGEGRRAMGDEQAGGEEAKNGKREKGYDTSARYVKPRLL
jgi:hypothetical protein